MGLEKIAKTFGNIAKKCKSPLIGIGEYCVYIGSMYEISKFYGKEDFPLWMILFLLPIGAYATCDSLSRILFKSPVYKLNIEEEKNFSDNEVSKEIEN